MGVRRAQREVDSREFEEWRAYHRITHDPDDRRTAEILSALWKIAAGYRRTAMEPADFLPQKRVRKAPPAPEAPDHVEIGCKLKAAFGMIKKAQREKREREQNKS
jgi:hypothetical protein